MDKNTVKKTVKYVVALSVGTVIKNIVQSHCDPTTSIQKAETVIGSYMLGAMVGDSAAAYVDGWFEGFENKQSEVNPPA